MLRIEEVLTKNDLLKFIKFPTKLHSNNPNYVPQLFSEENNVYLPNKNDCFSYCDIKEYLIYDEKKIVGRFATIINHKYNNLKNVSDLRFSRLDLINSKEVFDFIINELLRIAKENNLKTIIGPIGFNTFDYSGLLIDGFDLMTTCYCNYTDEYVYKFLEEYGFTIDNELNVYEFDIDVIEDQRFNDILNYNCDKYHLKFKKPNTNSESIEMITEGLKLYNEVNKTVTNDLYFTDLTSKQIKDLTNDFILFANFKYICGLYDENNKLICFGMYLPSLAKAFKKGDGTMNIISTMRVAKALKQNDTLDLPLFICLREYQNYSLESLIFIKLLETFKENNIKKIYTKPIYSEALPKFVIDGYEFKVYKKYGIFKYKL